jgi:hypothetical protein
MIGPDPSPFRLLSSLPCLAFKHFGYGSTFAGRVRSSSNGVNGHWGFAIIIFRRHGER